MGTLEAVRGVPELAVESRLPGLVESRLLDGASYRFDALVDDTLDVVVELVHRRVQVDIMVFGVEAYARKLVDAGLYVLRRVRLGESDVLHVDGGAVLAAHGSLGAVAGGVEAPVPVAEEDDLRSGVLHTRVVRRVAELHDLLNGPLLERFVSLAIAGQNPLILSM